MRASGAAVPGGVSVVTTNTGELGRAESSRGVVPPTPGGGRGSAAAVAPKGLQGAVATLPEAAGMPMDDSVAYVILLRRLLMFGPGLGMVAATGAPGMAGGPGGVLAVAGTVGRMGPAMSMTGGLLEQSPSVVFSLV